jgi:hypothetical protein
MSAAATSVIVQHNQLPIQGLSLVTLDHVVIVYLTLPLDGVKRTY